MKPRDDDLRAWAAVAATVRPLPGRRLPTPTTPPARPIANAPKGPPPRRRDGQPPPFGIEPNRRRQLFLGREPIGARIDLHGLDHDGARDALTRFLLRAADQGLRGLLVITGKGLLGDGVLRRRVPEWLAEAPLRPLIAGLSEAHRRHGGQGALYVALRRRKA